MAGYSALAQHNEALALDLNFSLTPWLQPGARPASREFSRFNGFFVREAKPLKRLNCSAPPDPPG